MAPAKKQKHKQSFKPSISYAHPSLSTSPRASSPAGQDGSASVSSRIEYLRRVQRPSSASLAEVATNLSTLKIRTPPTGKFSGPPPPKSWLSGDVSGQGTAQSLRARILRPRSPGYLPGLQPPEERSFTHLIMRDMAQNIHWHLVYDNVYLSALPVDVKSMLLSYVACYSPPDGISSSEVKTIFISPEVSGLEEATGAEGLSRLDLACSIGRSISLSDLGKLWITRSKSGKQQETPPDETSTEGLSPPESWEDSWDMWRTKAPSAIHTKMRFPEVTHLSLGYPGPEVSWSELITLSRHFRQLTHLCLAGWPRATVPFDDAITSNCPDLKRVIAREHRDIACDVLRVLARNMPSLIYLSLAECHGWYQDLRENVAGAFDDSTRSSKGPAASIWSYVWRHLDRLDLSQSKPPPRNVDTATLRNLYDARLWRGDRQIQNDSPQADIGGEQPQRAPPALARRVQEEAYTVTGSSDTVRAVEERQMRRQWLDNETLALDLGTHINLERHRAGLRILTVEYGWGPRELRQAGYSKEEVWKITGHEGS